ncbi:MAG TPA: 2'-5' RNA ligase family protein, partial [Pseudomonadales bacterium]|nr:2'-5' RNA ligase family protein [Pseudomonadales bacterium]
MFEALRAYRAEFAEPACRWIDPGNYHVTLRFFGDLTRDRIDRAARAIAPVAAASAPIDCRVDAFLALPNSRRPTVLALTLASSVIAPTVQSARDP